MVVFLYEIFLSGKNGRVQLVSISILSLIFTVLDLSVADGFLNLDSEYWSWIQGVDKEPIEK